MLRYEVDFSHTQDTSVALVNAKEVPRDLWANLRNIQLSAVESQLSGTPLERRERAERILRLTGLNAFYENYVASRVRPNDFVGVPGWWRSNQQVTDPQIAVLYAGNRVAGAVLADSNVSGSERARAVKSHYPPKNYLRLREGYVDPDIHHVGTAQNERTVSGLVVAGLRDILHHTNKFRRASQYVVYGDEADAEREGLATITGMTPQPPQGERTSALVGYPADTLLTRVEAKVGTMRGTIDALPGAQEAFANVAWFDTLLDVA